jgi:hypothetical protein
MSAAVIDNQEGIKDSFWALAADELTSHKLKDANIVWKKELDLRPLGRWWRSRSRHLYVDRDLQNE